VKKRQNFKDIFAEVVSRVLDPVWEIPAVILLAIGFAVKEGLRWRFVGLLLFIDFVVPFIFFLTMLYHRQIDNWDMQKRSQRLPLIIFGLLCNLGGLWLARELGKDELVSILVVFYSIALVFGLITAKWKISLHAGMNAVLISMINIFYGYKYFWMYGLLALVAWARVYQKHHTWLQVIVGSALGIVMVTLGMYLVSAGQLVFIDMD
jgi:membrane-associated phospholipid phosphatase